MTLKDKLKTLTISDLKVVKDHANDRLSGIFCFGKWIDEERRDEYLAVIKTIDQMLDEFITTLNPLDKETV